MIKKMFETTTWLVAQSHVMSDVEILKSFIPKRQTTTFLSWFILLDGCNLEIRVATRTVHHKQYVRGKEQIKFQ